MKLKFSQSVRRWNKVYRFVL